MRSAVLAKLRPEGSMKPLVSMEKVAWGARLMVKGPIEKLPIPSPPPKDSSSKRTIWKLLVLTEVTVPAKDIWLGGCKNFTSKARSDPSGFILASTLTIWPVCKQEKFSALRDVLKSKCVLLSVAIVKEGRFIPL